MHSSICGRVVRWVSSSSVTDDCCRNWSPTWRRPARARSRASWRSPGPDCPLDAHPRHWAARLSIARGFAAYLQTIDAETEIPPAGVFAVRYQRPTPYLWSGEDISRLLEATRALRPPLKAASYQALFGLLAVTGMRLGEAIALEPDDVDLDNGVITIRAHTAKLERARMVPLHPTTVQAPRALRQRRERGCAQGRDRARSFSPASAPASIAAKSPRRCAS